MTSKLAYLQSLPRKRSACGVLFVKDGRLLIVKPTYKEGWSVPGGILEAGESPRAGALRECAEELGIRVQVGPLVVVDWMAETVPGGGDSVQFLFMGVPLSDEDEGQITLPADELAEWRYVALKDVGTFLSPNLKKRVLVALRCEMGAVQYLENGEAV